MNAFFFHGFFGDRRVKSVDFHVETMGDFGEGAANSTESVQAKFFAFEFTA